MIVSSKVSMNQQSRNLFRFQYKVNGKYLITIQVNYGYSPYETFSTLIKILSFTVLEALPTFNQTTRSMHPSLPPWCFNNFCKYFSVLIVSLNSCNVCVFWFCIFSNRLDLFQATCSIIQQIDKYYFLTITPF